MATIKIDFPIILVSWIESNEKKSPLKNNEMRFLNLIIVYINIIRLKIVRPVI